MRPQFHFTVNRGWINDPHGITVHNGQYEVFFQYAPGQLDWALQAHWGHAVGPDLFSLTEGEPALGPGDGDDGIWTGTLATGDDGIARIFYTTVAEPDIQMGRIRQARPVDDSWSSWTKGPVVAEPPAELDIVAYRDPFVFRDGASWRMFVGASLRDGTVAALCYASETLDRWSYEGIAVERSSRDQDPIWMGALWECPQLIDLGDHHALLCSVWDQDPFYTAYGMGNYQDGRFHPDTWRRLSYGPSLYAPSYFRDRQGRHCLLYWVRHVADPVAGWASAHSIPYVVDTVGDQLIATPHPDLEKYRGEPVDPSAATGLLGSAADIAWRPAGPAGTLELTVDGQPLADLSVTDDELTVHWGSESCALPYVDGELRIILDGPVLEIAGAGGVFAGALAAWSGQLQVSASGSATVWPLHRNAHQARSPA